MDAKTLIWIAGWTLSLLLSYTIVRERRSPNSTTAWLVFVFAFPFVGALIYLLIGTRKRVGRSRRRLRPPRQFAGASLKPHGSRGLEDFISRLGMLPATDNHLLIHTEARLAREELIRVIDSAQRELHFLVYDFFRDASGKAVLAAIERAAARGVNVRLLVDDLGSWTLSSTHLQRLQRKGVHFKRFKPLWSSLRARMANLRNHRKIVVADSTLAWTGGRNIGDHYLADHAEQNRWADLSVTVQGPAAALLDEVARADWQFATGEELASALATAAPAETTPTSMQVLASGPDQRDDLWHAALLKSLMDARKRIYIATPYFVPDDSVLQALSIASRSGVDVRVLVPQRSDNKLVDLVGMSFLRELARQGVTVMRYNSGMLHTKLTLVDDMAILGSANFDARSFFLNYEAVIFCYDSPVINELEQYYQKLEARANRGVRARPSWREALAGCARVLAPML